MDAKVTFRTLALAKSLMMLAKSKSRSRSLSIVMSVKKFNLSSFIVVRIAFFTRPSAENDRSPEQLATIRVRYIRKATLTFRRHPGRTQRCNTVLQCSSWHLSSSHVETCHPVLNYLRNTWTESFLHLVKVPDPLNTHEPTCCRLHADRSQALREINYIV